jgi:hypothetical protein
MGWLVLKVNRDPEEDRWCLWSTIVEAPVFDGTQADMTRMYLRQYGEIVRRELMLRIERAITHGAGTDWEGDWDGEDTGMIYKQMGIMPREKLGELLDIVSTQERPDEGVRPLLRPFDD